MHVCVAACVLQKTKQRVQLSGVQNRRKLEETLQDV